jgi:hypothetical protein
LTTPSGGFILSDYGDEFEIGAENNKKEMMFKAFLDLDPWKKPVCKSPGL